MLLLASAVVVAALGGCPKPPVHHVKHKPDAPLCSCTFVEPRTIILQAPEAAPEPGELSVVRYYVPFTTDTDYESAPEDMKFDNWSSGYYGAYGYTTGISQVTKCPELDPSSLGAGLALLAGSIAVLRSGKIRCQK